MVRVAAYVPDLLFGSNVAGALSAAGHETSLVSDPADPRVAEAAVLVIDLTADAAQRIERVAAIRRPDLRTLAFYSHVETDVRALADDAGFDLVIPRSRMAREGPVLVARLAEQ